MTNGNEGRMTARQRQNRWMAGGMAAVLIMLLASCTGMTGPLKPAWQQDPVLQHHGVPGRAAQTSNTPHVVARVIYAGPEWLARLLEAQGDVVHVVRGPARMGDGSLEVGLQDAATGRWLEGQLCGGVLFVAGLPNQAYRIVVRNRTPQPLELSVGVDGKKIADGKPALWERGGPRVEARGTVVLEHLAGRPLLFQPVGSDAALYDFGPQGRTGLLQVAAFLAADAPSLLPEKLRAGQVAPLGLLPMVPPEQYR